jgi:anti-sigma28 factor (negative regulator of flagellin synthesis)
MRINSIATHLNVENVKKMEKERKEAASANKAGRDASIISSDGKRLNATASDVNTVKTQVEIRPEIRPEKVEEARAKIKSGYYNSEEFIDRLAEKIMKDFGI